MVNQETDYFFAPRIRIFYTRLSKSNQGVNFFFATSYKLARSVLPKARCHRHAKRASKRLQAIRSTKNRVDYPSLLAHPQKKGRHANHPPERGWRITIAEAEFCHPGRNVFPR